MRLSLGLSVCSARAARKSEVCPTSARKNMLAIGNSLHSWQQTNKTTILNPYDDQKDATEAVKKP
jgi:hypothetical protein